MEVNKEELRRLAEAAKVKSSGYWSVFTPEHYQGPDQLPGLGVEDCEGKAIVWYAEVPDSGIQYDEHASFIAAANPAAILSLLDDADAREKKARETSLLWLDENAQLRAENERLRALLLEASEEIDSWGSYASEYFQQKHDLSGTVAKFHAAAMAKEGNAKP